MYALIKNMYYPNIEAKHKLGDIQFVINVPLWRRYLLIIFRG